MNFKAFKLIVEKGIKDIYKNPQIIIPSAALWGILIILSKISVTVNHKLSHSVAITAWFIFFSLLTFFIMSFVFAGIISMSKKAAKGKTSFSDFFTNMKNYGLKNFFIVMTLVIMSIVVGRIAHYVTLFLGKQLSIPVNVAQVIFMILYFIGLVGILIFLTFSSFYVVLEGKGYKKSISSSIKLVKKEYTATLSIIVLLFLVLFLINLIPGIWGEACEYILFIPLTSAILTRFVLHREKNDL